FTAPDHPWINHENLAEIVFAAAVRLAGPAGLLALRALLALAVFALLVPGVERRRLGRGTAAFLLLAIACNLAPWWTVRPQLFTHTFFALEIFLVERAFADRARPDPRWLAGLPLLFALWANTHGGFVAGFAIL